MFIVRDAGPRLVRCRHLAAWAREERRSGATQPQLRQAPIRSTQPTVRLRPPTSLLPTRPSSHYTASPSRVSFRPQHHCHLETIRARFHHPHSRRRRRRSPPPLGELSASSIVPDRCTVRARPTTFFERASVRQAIAQPTATSSHPGIPPSPAAAYTPTDSQQRAVPSGQMRSNRAPHTVSQ